MTRPRGPCMSSSTNCLTSTVFNLHVNGGSYTPSDQSISSNRLEALGLVGVLLGAHWVHTQCAVISNPQVKYFLNASSSLPTEQKRVCIIVSLKAYHAERLTVSTQHQQ